MAMHWWFNMRKKPSSVYEGMWISNIEVPTRCICYRVYFSLTIAVHVSGIIVTHLQEYKTTVTIASGNRYTLLLSAAIVEELEPVRHPQHTQTGSNLRIWDSRMHLNFDTLDLFFGRPHDSSIESKHVAIRIICIINCCVWLKFILRMNQINTSGWQTLK